MNCDSWHPSPKKLNTLRNISGRLAKLMLFISCLAVYALPAMAQERTNTANESTSIDPNDPAVLTESQVIQAALNYSKTLNSLSTNVEIAGYRLKSAGWMENPELRISDVSTSYFNAEIDELRVGLRFRFPQFGELGEEKQQARVDLWELKVDQARYRHALITKVRKDMANVFLFDQLVEIAEKKVAKADERIHIIERLVETGDRSILYLTKAKLWQQESNNDLARAQQNQRLARLELANVTGIPQQTSLVHTELLELNVNLDELIQLAYDHRPEIEFVHQTIALARQRKQLEYMKLVPSINFVEISYHAERPGDEDWTEFMAGINIPLFNWNLGNIKATQLAVKKSRNELDAAKELIAEQVRSSFLIFKDVWLDWITFRSSTLEIIETATHVINQAKQHGTLMPDDVVDMEWTIFDTKVILAEKEREAVHALYDLYFALGIEDDALILNR